MKSLSFIADHDAQSINGGLGKRSMSRFNTPSYTFNSISYKGITTNLGQQNVATNLGVGLLYGIGVASSEQVNLASITSAIG
jgi:hypothetical protein